MRDAFIQRLQELATTDKRIFLVTGDLGFGVLTKFSETLPDQYLNAGVAEQNMTGIATGMALDGRIVFTYSIGNFPTLRCLEQVRNDACYHEANVKIVCIGGGYTYGVLGMSHHATEDLSILRALPNMTVVAPANDFETVAAVDALIARSGCCYLRLERAAGFVDPGSEPFIIGRARRLRDGDALTLIGTGGIMSEVLAAAEVLAAKGIQCRVMSYHTLKPLDIEALNQACRETGGILSVEENVLAGGLGSALAEACFDNGFAPQRFFRLGVRDQYCKMVGAQDYLRKCNQIDRDSIVAAAIALLNRPGRTDSDEQRRAGHRAAPAAPPRESTLKRVLDIVISAALLFAASPLLVPILIATWAYDHGSPFYIAPRVGRGGTHFDMVKLRSMVVNADRTGVMSTSADDRRITAVGHFVRRYKLDELMQLWNVFKGDMSLVGPRPNVPSGVSVYTEAERRLVSVRPGITDFASIVFSDEGDILAGQADPDLAYDQLIRPWKSRLGLFYVDNGSVLVDLQLVWLTAVAMLSTPAALRGIVELLQRLGAPDDLINIARRDKPLEPALPPGASMVVSRSGVIPA